MSAKAFAELSSIPFYADEITDDKIRAGADPVTVAARRHGVKRTRENIEAILRYLSENSIPGWETEKAVLALKQSGALALVVQ
jgi:hypothetical protein